MKLPRADQAVVEKAKIVDYLLSPTHEDGRHKAKFFNALGFRLEAWKELAAALCEHAARHSVGTVKVSPYGTRYTIDGILNSPSGQRPRVRTVWRIDAEQGGPRLITAHPLKKARDDQGA